MANPKAEVEISAHSRNLGSKLREARSKFSSFGGDLKKNIFGKDLSESKGFFSKGGAQMVGNLGSSVVGAAAGLFADQAKSVMDFNDKLVRLQITAEATPEEMQAFATSVRVASDATGKAKGEILDAGAAYVALTGDMATAQSQIGNWAKISQASGSSMADVSSAAAALKQNMKIDPGDTLEAFGILVEGGKKGAVEMKDLASQLANIAPQWAQMFKGGSGIQGLKEMQASLQIAKRGFGGEASETVTGVQGMLTAFVKNAKRFEAAGVKMFDTDPKTGKKNMRNVLDIVDSIANSKLVKDPTKMEKAFGRVEAYRAYLQLSANRGELQGLIDDAGNATTIQKDLDTYLQSTAGKTSQAFEQAKNSIQEAFTPERIEAFASVVTKLIGALATVASAASSILDKAKDFGENLAKGGGAWDWIGGAVGINSGTARAAGAGKSAEDEAGDIVDAQQAQRQRLRLIQAEKQVRKEAGLSNLPATDTTYAAAAKRIAAEDAMRVDVQKSKHTPAELVAIRAKAKGATNESVIYQAIDAAMAKQADALRDIAKALTGLGSKTVVKVDSKVVASAVRNSPDAARRPGQ